MKPRWRVWGLVGLLLGAGVACVSQASAPSGTAPVTRADREPVGEERETGSETQAASGPHLRVGPGVTAEEAATVRVALEEAVELIEEATGYGPPPFEVHLQSDIDGMAAAWCDAYDTQPCPDGVVDMFGSTVGNSWPGLIFTRTDGWPIVAGGGRSVMLHEYVHILQYDLADVSPADVSALPEQVRPSGPMWLAEGQAEYFRYVVEQGEAFEHWLVLMRHLAGMDDVDGPRLKALETARDYSEGLADDRTITLTIVAVDVLTQDFGATLHDHLAFSERVGQGATWEESFTETFGVTIEDFYEHIDALDGSGTR